MVREIPIIEITDDKDGEYSKKFWEKGKPEGLREAMIENIISATNTGFIGIFVSLDGYTENDKEKMSAYRVLAKEIGYEIGPYKLDRKTGVASADIRKIAK
jgi:hypothetical protein